MRGKLIVSTFLTASLGAMALAADAPPARPRGRAGASDKGVTLLHWWTSPGEMAALEALSQEFKGKHPGTPLTVTDAHSHGGGGRIFAAARSAAAAGNPPDAIHVNGGATMRPYLDAGLLNS